MNGMENRETVLTLADSSSEVKERRVVYDAEGNEIMVNLNSNCLAPAAIIISPNDKHPGDHDSRIDPSSATFLTSTSQLTSSTSLEGENGNFQVIGVAAGEGGEQILVITPLSNPAPVQTEPPPPPAPIEPITQQDHQQPPLIINGLHFQAAPSIVTSSEQLNDTAILAAQFELIKSTCPTLNEDHGERDVIPMALTQEPDVSAATVTLQGPPEADEPEEDGVVILYQGKQSSSNVENIIESVATTTESLPATASSDSVYDPDIIDVTDELEEDTDAPTVGCRTCVVCLRKRPITRDIFDANMVLNQSMAILTAYLYIDARSDGDKAVGICPPCLDQLLNWHAFSTAIQSRHEAVRTSAVNFDNVPVKDAPIKTRLYHNPKKTAALKKHYWSQSGQHSYLARRYLTDSDWDWICEYLEKHPPPPEHEKLLVQTYLHSTEKLTHLFCIFCRRFIDGGKKGFADHMIRNHNTTKSDVRFPCEICGMLNSDEDNAYFTHWISHLYAEKCDRCTEIFPNGRVLRQHLLSRHQKRRPRPKVRKRPRTKHIECPHCDVHLSTASSLKKHIDYKHYDGPLQHTCTLCNKQFRWRYLLTRHERIVHRPSKRGGAKETKGEQKKKKSKSMSGDANQPMQADPTAPEPNKGLKRQNYSPDINPEAHTNGFAGAGEIQQEKDSSSEVSLIQSESEKGDIIEELVSTPIEGVSSSSSSNFSMATDSVQSSVNSSQQRSDTEDSSKFYENNSSSSNLTVVNE